ncbi:hypothetical protein HDU96_010316, partial [Phlyctochytrium bullatum]
MVFSPRTTTVSLGSPPTSAAPTSRRSLLMMNPAASTVSPASPSSYPAAAMDTTTAPASFNPMMMGAPFYFNHHHHHGQTATTSSPIPVKMESPRSSPPVDIPTTLSPRAAAAMAAAHAAGRLSSSPLDVTLLAPADMSSDDMFLCTAPPPPPMSRTGSVKLNVMPGMVDPPRHTAPQRRTPKPSGGSIISHNSLLPMLDASGTTGTEDDDCGIYIDTDAAAAAATPFGNWDAMSMPMFPPAPVSRPSSAASSFASSAPPTPVHTQLFHPVAHTAAATPEPFLDNDAMLFATTLGMDPATAMAVAAAVNMATAAAPTGTFTTRPRSNSASSTSSDASTSSSARSDIAATTTAAFAYPTLFDTDSAAAAAFLGGFDPTLAAMVAEASATSTPSAPSPIPTPMDDVVPFESLTLMSPPMPRGSDAFPAATAPIAIPSTPAPTWGSASLPASPVGSFAHRQHAPATQGTGSYGSVGAWFHPAAGAAGFPTVRSMRPATASANPAPVHHQRRASDSLTLAAIASAPLVVGSAPVLPSPLASPSTVAACTPPPPPAQPLPSLPSPPPHVPSHDHQPRRPSIASVASTSSASAGSATLAAPSPVPVVAPAGRPRSPSDVSVRSCGSSDTPFDDDDDADDDDDTDADADSDSEVSDADTPVPAAAPAAPATPRRGAGPHPCACGKTFSSLGSLRQHAKNHHGNRTKDFGCARCGKTFLRKQDLRRHENTHTGVRPFACPLGCGTVFSRNDALQRHLK